jgi:hypothetical protein
MKKVIATLALGMMIPAALLADGYHEFHGAEAAINDIPFDTEEVFSEQMSVRAMTVAFEPAEETFINDIPFDTRPLASFELRFKMPEEEFVNDIPFDTHRIAEKNK